MRKFLAALILLGLGAPALGQTPINVVPQVGLTWGYLPKATYSAGFTGLVPAASATDVVCLAGSATKTVKVTKIVLGGTAGTLVTLPVLLTKKATADSGGTAAGTTANPANTITPLDSQFPTATAVPISYTANPTINAAGTILAARTLTLPVTSAGVASIPTVWDFGAGNSNLLSPIVLRGAAQQICLNFSAVSVSSGLLAGYLEWTEE